VAALLPAPEVSDEAAATLGSAFAAGAAPAEAAPAAEPAADAPTDAAPAGEAPADDAATEAAPAEEASAINTDLGPAVDGAEPEAAETQPAGAPAALTEAELENLLDPASLDVGAVTEAIEASDLDAALKTQLSSALAAAEGSESLLPAVLERIRVALAGE
jgi:hypothetical protein